MRWDTALRGLGIAGFLGAYLLYLRFGSSFQVFAFVVAAIGTLVMPEFVDRLPVGPAKK